MAMSKMDVSILFMPAVLTALPWVCQLVMKPLDCQCPANFSEGNCQYANDYCWAQGLRDDDFDEPVSTDSTVQIEKSGQVSDLGIFFILLGVAMAMLPALPGIVQQFSVPMNDTCIRLLRVCGTVLAFLWLCWTLQTNFALWGWHRFQRIWTHDCKVWNIFSEQKPCDLWARFFFANSEDVAKTENIEVLTLQCFLNVNMWRECVFLMLWVWLVFVGLKSVVKLISPT